MALQGTPRVDDPAILIDSAAAEQWFRSHDFRTDEHKVEDHDNIQNIVPKRKLGAAAS